MPGASRDRVTIDLRGIGDAVRAAAGWRGMGVAQLVRRAVVMSLDLRATAAVLPMKRGSDGQTPDQVPTRETAKLPLRARADALIASVNRLLAEKGFDAMTIDEVAADVGIAKASLYKHFASKEELAAAAMTQVLEQAIAECERLAAMPEMAAQARLRAMARWALKEQLEGRMPSLPAQNSSLRAALMSHRLYMDRLLELSEQLGMWIEAAQSAGHIDAQLPVHVVLYSLFARGCDPVATQLKASGEHSNEEIVDWLLRTCFTGLQGPSA